jgi:nucleoid-associated protein YgaU
MVRFLRLVASVLMLTSGVWLVVACVRVPPQSQPSPVESVAASVGDDRPSPSHAPRLIPETVASADEEKVQQAATAAVLAPLAPLVTSSAIAPPPQPMPAVPSELTQVAPPLESAYRSALDLPPPPLLDAHSPPPLVGGSTWKQTPTSVTTASFQTPPRGEQANAPFPGEPPPPPPQATVYAVSDGDDLTSIATRFYGHPSAARLVYEANRDRLPSPDLLPIGVVLVLPPPPDRSGRDQRPGGWIEPSQPE